MIIFFESICIFFLELLLLLGVVNVLYGMAVRAVITGEGGRRVSVSVNNLDSEPESDSDSDSGVEMVCFDTSKIPWGGELFILLMEGGEGTGGIGVGVMRVVVKGWGGGIVIEGAVSTGGVDVVDVHTESFVCGLFKIISCE